MKIYSNNRNTPTSNFRRKGNLVWGYSLVEILIYLAIFTVLSILVINSFIIILSSFNATSINRKLLESGLSSMERVSREIRQSKDIDIANSSSTILQLNSTNSLNNNTIIKIASENGDLNLYEDNNLVGNLLNENISLTNLMFRRISTTEGQAVKIEMTLEYSRGNNIKSENFYNTIILRGGY